MKESENITARESLEIIAAMIQEAKGNVQRNNFFFLLWGWVVVVANLGMWALDRLDFERPYAIWLITVPAWIYTLNKVFSRDRRARAKSHFDRITAWLWLTFGVTISCLVIFGFRINYQLNPVILTVTAIPTIVSGVILNFRPLIAGGAVFWMAGVTCFLVPLEAQPLLGAGAIACGYLIPGYMLRSRNA